MMKKDSQHLLYSIPFRYCLKQHSAARKEQIAIIDGLSGEAVTYGALHDRVARIAGWLNQNGIGCGDRVACLSLNRKSYAEFFFALAWIGAVAVPLNIRLHPKELEFIIQDSGAKAVFSCEAMRETLEAATVDIAGIDRKILDGEPGEGWIAYQQLADFASPALQMDEEVSGHTLFMLLYTSGTTGKPKGCMIPQRSWTGYAVNMAACFQMGPQDVYLAFLPFFHVAGFGAAFSQLILGGTIVTAPAPDPRLFYQLIEKHRVTIMFLVPGISAAFVYDESREGVDVSSLKTFIGGAGLEKLQLVEDTERLLGVKYYCIYGQTESGSKITWADSDMLREDPSTYGHVMPFFEYRIMDENDNPLDPGMVGELCIRGETVMQGYWNRPEATAETLKNEWHHTGDLFIQNENGQVKMVDRKKYLVKTGGENVYPQEVEQVLLSHEDISDAAVIGIPDEKWGETVKAFVVLRAGASLSRQDIAVYVGRFIAGYKKPRYVAFVEEIPRNVSGKILKNELSGYETTAEQMV
jgi:acyl-CoA synthetase (AMP-forming)/AMP-acid ligase II